MAVEIVGRVDEFGREIAGASLSWEVVDALLSNPSLEIEAIALPTGFGDLAAFSKAFERWAGCSPTEHRERIVSRISGAAA